MNSRGALLAAQERSLLVVTSDAPLVCLIQVQKGGVPVLTRRVIVSTQTAASSRRSRKHRPSAACNQRKIDAIFDRLTEAYGINKTARIHKALLHGQITPEIRRKVRLALCC